MTANKQSFRVARFGDNGAYIVLYTPCGENGEVSFGLSDARTPVRILETPSPSLQILVMEKASGPSVKKPLEINGLSVNGATPENTGFFSSMLYDSTFGTPGWIGMSWLMTPLEKKPVRTKVSFSVSGLDPSSPSFVIFLLNFNAGKNGRARRFLTQAELYGR